MPPLQDPRHVRFHGTLGRLPGRATASLHLQPFEGQLDRPRRVPAVAQLSDGRGTFPHCNSLQGPPLPRREQTMETLLPPPSVDHRLAPVEDPSSPRVPGDLHAAAFCPDGNAFPCRRRPGTRRPRARARVPRRVTSRPRDAVHLDVERWARLKSPGSWCFPSGLASPLHGHALSPRLRPPSRAWFTAIRTLGPVPPAHLCRRPPMESPGPRDRALGLSPFQNLLDPALPSGRCGR